MLQIKKRIITDKNGKAASVVLTKKEFDRLVCYIEELEDVASYDSAKKVKGAARKWEDVKR
ncbi:MAG: hypothetical protein MUD12_13130 [Spirochaetes bacterium]|nr:hypothetical protein [Spirochaetota bacterium]